MRWPPSGFDNLLVDAEVDLRAYASVDAPALFAALDDARAWEHIPRDIPADSSDLDESVKQKLIDGLRLTFVIRNRTAQPDVPTPRQSIMMLVRSTSGLISPTS